MTAISKALAFVTILWVAFLLNAISPLDFRVFGLIPRDPWGLLGIPLMPLLHRNVHHLVYNSIGLLVLLTALHSCVRNPDRVYAACLRIILISGCLLWIFGRGISDNGLLMVHIGASGVVYGLMSFAATCSILTKNVPLFMFSFFVFAYTGMSMIDGLLPFQTDISWDGHIAGAIAGIIAASIDHKDLTCSAPPESPSRSLKS